MAERDCNANSNSSKAQRRYKVGYISRCHADRHMASLAIYSQPPVCTSRHWLEEAGFATDRRCR